MPGRFRFQAEVQRILESKPDFPKNQPNGKIRAWKIAKIQKNPIYAGYVQAKRWGVSLRKGHHEPPISFAAYEQIQRNLVEGARPPARADCDVDFQHCDKKHLHRCAAEFEFRYNNRVANGVGVCRAVCKIGLYVIR